MTTKGLLDREPVLRYLRKLTEQRLGKRAPVGVGAHEVTVTGASVRSFAMARPAAPAKAKSANYAKAASAPKRLPKPRAASKK